MTRADKTARKDAVEPIYSDIMVNFNAHPNTGNLIVKTNADAVKRGLRNLLMTDKGERFFNKNIGSDIRTVLFEPPTEVNQRQLKSIITETIENYEKRVILRDVVVTLTGGGDTYNIDVYFSMINSPETHNFSVKMDRIR